MKSRKTSRISMTSNVAQEPSVRDEEPTAVEIQALQPSTTARMIFDSSLSSLPSGVRGMGQDRHLLFVAADLNIHVKITEADRHKEIYGQVISQATNGESPMIMLVSEEVSKEMRRTDQFGEFSFDEVPAGNVAIEIVLATRRVVAAFDV
jgi:hypothetical protein